MIFQIFTGCLRAILAAYGGKLVEQGYVSSDDLSSGIGGILVVVTIAWSAWQKYRTHTVPGGDFNPKAEVRKAQRPKNGGFAAIKSLVLIMAAYALLGAVVCATTEVRLRATPERIGGKMLSEWIQVVPIVDSRPFWNRLLASIRVTPSVAVAYLDGAATVKITKIELKGGAEF